MTTTATPQQHLARTVELWPHLTDMLDTWHTAPWPPPGRLTHYLAALDQADAEEVRQARELEVPAGRPPLRLTILDTMRLVERTLLDCADQTASSVQRPAASARAAGPGDEVGRKLSLAAAQDQADPTRWSWTNPHTRTAPYAAIWLTHRLDNAPGPFRPLTLLQRERIATVAAGTLDRIERALDLARRSTTTRHDCPHCREPLTVHGGDGQPPQVRCTSPDCGWTRTAVGDAA